MLIIYRLRVNIYSNILRGINKCLAREWWRAWKTRTPVGPTSSFAPIKVLNWWREERESAGGVSRLHHPNSCCSLLGSILEITNKFGNIVLVLLTGLALGNVAHLADVVLESSELLGTDLLENIRKHVLKFLGLRVACHNEKVLSDGELDYNKCYVNSRFIQFLVSYSEVSWSEWQCYHPWTCSPRRCPEEAERLKSQD